MTKPRLILDQHFRRMDELFSDDVYAALNARCDIIGGQDRPLPRAEILAHLPEAAVYVAARPALDAAEVARAARLKAVIEVSGAFREGLDYAACFERGIEVLSCAPGFRHAVGEMALAMMLSGARGLIAEHEAFRAGAERWLDERVETDFSLFGQSVGFIGYGQIARETHRLLQPFAPTVMAFDPFLSSAGPDAELTDLETLVSQCRVVVVAAVPSSETRNLLNADLISRLRPGALVIVVSRAWCVDFPALLAAADAGRILLAADVFPEEPVAPDDPLRRARNVILSPHRAAAVQGGRRPIGEMILHDVRAILEGRAERRLKPADPATVASQTAAQIHVPGP